MPQRQRVSVYLVSQARPAMSSVGTARPCASFAQLVVLLKTEECSPAKTAPGAILEIRPAQTIKQSLVWGVMLGFIPKETEARCAQLVSQENFRESYTRSMCRSVKTVSRENSPHCQEHLLTAAASIAQEAERLQTQVSRVKIPASNARRAGTPTQARRRRVASPVAKVATLIRTVLV